MVCCMGLWCGRSMMSHIRIQLVCQSAKTLDPVTCINIMKPLMIRKSMKLSREDTIACCSRYTEFLTIFVRTLALSTSTSSSGIRHRCRLVSASFPPLTFRTRPICSLFCPCCTSCSLYPVAFLYYTSCIGKTC